MAVFPTFAQHPIGAIPLGAYPTYARVGIYEVVTSSGVRRLRQHLIMQDRWLDQAVREDEELMELLKIILASGILD